MLFIIQCRGGSGNYHTRSPGEKRLLSKPSHAPRSPQMDLSLRSPFTTTTPLPPSTSPPITTSHFSLDGQQNPSEPNQAPLERAAPFSSFRHRHVHLVSLLSSSISKSICLLDYGCGMPPAPFSFPLRQYAFACRSRTHRRIYNFHPT